MAINRTILLTGASGFLGTWLGDEAVKAGYKVIGIDLRAPLRPQIWERFATSSLETVDLTQLLAGQSLYAVCHLAGGASVMGSVNDPYGDFSSLLPGTARLALYLTKSQSAARLLLFSSAAVYGNPQELPIKETSPILPISPYGAHKAAAEALLLDYSRILGLNTTIFRIFSVFGPGLRKQLIWDVSQKALKAKENKYESITLFGTGSESRDFIFVKDLCQAVLTVLAHPEQDQVEIYNLASGIESIISQVAKRLVEQLEIDIDVCFNGEVPKGDPSNWQADITRLRTLGFKPRYSLEKGLEQVAMWLKTLHLNQTHV